MIRPFTCICMITAAGSGLYLYQTKHRAQLLDHEIARTYKQIDVTRDRIAALKAEWALLNEPERLNELAQQHTTLKTLAPTQFLAAADLPSHLPAPLPPGPPPIPPSAFPAHAFTTDDPASAPSAVTAPSIPTAAAKPAGRSFAVNDRPTPDRPTPDRPAPEKPTPDRQAADKAPAIAMHAAARPPVPPVAVASAQPAPAPAPPHPASLSTPAASLAQPAPSRILAPVMNVSAAAIQSDSARAQAPGSIGDSVARAARARATPQIIPATAPTYAPATYAAPAYAAPTYNTLAPAPTYQPAIGSALGTATRTALPPPVPFAASAH